MKYTPEEIITYCEEDDVKFIRLAFCDVFGKLKNISIMPGELQKAFTHGIAFDGSAITGFGMDLFSDLILHPDPDTLSALPWRPENGRVVRMFCKITYPDGTPFECDTRGLLMKAISDAKAAGLDFAFGSEQEFYLFTLDDEGEPTKKTVDTAGYMDVAPDDKGENVRRGICLTLEKMGIIPESSHHEEGPGQNEIAFRYSNALTSADNSISFKSVVKTVARSNGLSADFSPKPVENQPGNGFHINMSVKAENDPDCFNHMLAGVLNRIEDITLFLNASWNSYERLGKLKAPGYISWSRQNRSELIRIPAAKATFERIELRNADSSANPYLAYALLIYAAMEGIENKMSLPEPADFNIYTATKEQLAKLKPLPKDLIAACALAKKSEFVKEHVPATILDIYCNI